MPPYVTLFVLWTASGEPALPVLPERDLARAIELVRTERALQRARRRYTASAFEPCAEILLETEARLRTVIERISDFELLKTIHLWIGLCRAVGGNEAAARASFVLAARLPGPAPNPDLFPPQVMEMIADAERESAPRCVLPARLRGSLVDGHRAGSSLEVGEHYVAGRRAGRFTLDQDCKLAWTVDPHPPPGVLSKREAADPEIRAILQEQGALRAARKDGREEEAPWYQRHWWIWIVAGAAAVAIAVPTTYAITARESDRYTLSF